MCIAYRRQASSKMTDAERLVHLMDHHGLTGAELARLAGVSRAYITDIKKGRRPASDKIWRAFESVGGPAQVDRRLDPASSTTELRQSLVAGLDELVRRCQSRDALHDLLDEVLLYGGPGMRQRIQGYLEGLRQEQVSGDRRAQSA